MTDDDRVKFERGADLLKHVQAGKLFDDYWVPIGDGLLAVRRTVMAALHLKKAPRRLLQRRVRQSLCAKRRMPTCTRSSAPICSTAWSTSPTLWKCVRAGRRANEPSVNHPTSMAKRLQEFLNRAPGEAPRRNVSPMALLKDKNEQLTRTNLDLAERLTAAEHRDGSLFDVKKDNGRDIGRVLAENMPEWKWKEVRHEAEAVYKARKRPAG